MGSKETVKAQPLAEDVSPAKGPRERVEDTLHADERQVLYDWADRNRVRRADPAWAVAELFLVLSEATAQRLRAGAEAHVAARRDLTRALEEMQARLGEASATAEEAATHAAQRAAGVERAAEALQRPLDRAFRQLEPYGHRRHRWRAAHALLLLTLAAGAFLAGDRYRAGQAYERLPVEVMAESGTTTAGEVLTQHLYWALDDSGRAELRTFVERASADSVRLSERDGHLLIERSGRRTVVERGGGSGF